MASQTTSSSLTMALTGKTASVDIPKPRPGMQTSRSGQPAMLPTPPNSISPSLPPQAFKRRGDQVPGSPSSIASLVDSDIDLHDTGAQNRSNVNDMDNLGAITPAMLAEYHLPDLLLSEGPLAIRHIMGYIATTVPGFTQIPPAKARRLVVAALEGKGNGLEGGGIMGDVIFEKVGWGHWNARRRGEVSRDRQIMQSSSPSSILGQIYQREMPSFQHSSIRSNRVDTSTYGTSMGGDSAVFSHSEVEYLVHDDMSMLEHEADKMSLDGVFRDYCSSSEAPEDHPEDDEWREEDVTDEEDWAQIGAAALRARSLNGAGGFLGEHSKNTLPQFRGGGPSTSTLAKSVPRNLSFQPPLWTIPDGLVGDTEERAAVEALLQLGST